MEVKAYIKDLRMSPRKVKIVVVRFADWSPEIPG